MHPMSPNRKRRSMNGAVWLIMVWQGRWHVRQDLPPVLDEEIAKRYAADQTRMSGNKHKAQEYAAAKR